MEQKHSAKVYPRANTGDFLVIHRYYSGRAGVEKQKTKMSEERNFKRKKETRKKGIEVIFQQIRD